MSRDIDVPLSLEVETHNNLEIQYHGFSSWADLDLVKGVMNNHLLQLLPAWLTELHMFRYDEAEGGDHAASCAPSPHYRKASMQLFNPLFNGSKDSVRQILTHEVIHILHSPVIDWLQDMVFPLMEEKEFLERQFNRQVEAFTQDFAEVLRRNLSIDGGNP